MQDVDLFLSLAEIAGIFVGFGALIALRGSAADAFDVTYIGVVVWQAVMIVIAALAPVALSRFGVTGHGLWLPCSVLALALFWLGDEVNRRLSRERRAALAARPLKARVREELAGGLLWIPATVALVLIALGLFPEREEALYFAAIALLLALDAGVLLMAVLRLGRPQET